MTPECGNKRTGEMQEKMIGVRNAAFLGRPFPPYDLTRLPGMFFLQQGGLSYSEGLYFCAETGCRACGEAFPRRSVGTRNAALKP